MAITERKGYFQKYTNLHRLASESLVAAVKYGTSASLDEAEEYAKEALTLAQTYREIILSKGILFTIDLERIAFQAGTEFGVDPKESSE